MSFISKIQTHYQVTAAFGSAAKIKVSKDGMQYYVKKVTPGRVILCSDVGQALVCGDALAVIDSIKKSNPTFFHTLEPGWGHSKRTSKWYVSAKDLSFEVV